MQSMYRYLGVNDTFFPDVNRKAQVAKIPKNQAVNNLLQRKNILRSATANILRVVMPVEARQKLRDRLINLNSHAKQQAPLSPEERQQLIELYREDILKLQDLVGRDLSGWLIANC